MSVSGGYGKRYGTVPASVGQAVFDATQNKENFARSVINTRLNFQERNLDMQEAAQAMTLDLHQFRKNEALRHELNQLQQRGARRVTREDQLTGLPTYVDSDGATWEIPDFSPAQIAQQKHNAQFAGFRQLGEEDDPANFNTVSLADGTMMGQETKAFKNFKEEQKFLENAGAIPAESVLPGAEGDFKPYAGKHGINVGKNFVIPMTEQEIAAKQQKQLEDSVELQTKQVKLANSKLDGKQKVANLNKSTIDYQTALVDFDKKTVELQKAIDDFNKGPDKKYTPQQNKRIAQLNVEMNDKQQKGREILKDIRAAEKKVTELEANAVFAGESKKAEAEIVAAKKDYNHKLEQYAQVNKTIEKIEANVYSIIDNPGATQKKVKKAKKVDYSKLTPTDKAKGKNGIVVPVDVLIAQVVKAKKVTDKEAVEFLKKQGVIK